MTTAVAALVAVAALQHCPPASVGPGSLHRGGTAGAACLLAAFRDGCRPADYTLSAFGVDTIHTRAFRTARRDGRCVALVTESYRVVPQQPHVTGHQACVRVRRTATDVVADRCTPAGTVSLTRLGPS
jgi:hypothetical protein